MDKFFQFFFSLILPILAGTLAMFFFFGSIRAEKFDVGISYFFLAFGLSYAGKKMFSGKFYGLSNMFGIILLFFAICIWSGGITSPNRFIDGLGHLLFGLILFLSRHKKLASVV